MCRARGTGPPAAAPRCRSAQSRSPCSVPRRPAPLKQRPGTALSPPVEASPPFDRLEVERGPNVPRGRPHDALWTLRTVYRLSAEPGPKSQHSKELGRNCGFLASRWYCTDCTNAQVTKSFFELTLQGSGLHIMLLWPLSTMLETCQILICVDFKLAQLNP